jgi:hypothetical protein
MSEQDDDDLAATPEELAEAEALARALARGGAADATGPAAPEDALPAAALLRAAARPGLDPARLEAAGARARAGVDARRGALDARRATRRRWALSALLVPAAAAAAMTLVARPRLSRVAPPPLPRPSAALLEAQARAARGRPDLQALDAEMRDYRAAYYAALAEEEP